MSSKIALQQSEIPIKEAWPEKKPEIHVKRKKSTNSFLRWLNKKWSDEDSTLRRSVSVIVLIMYSFLGSGLFYVMERDYYTYWQCLSYVNSIYTTIGFGQVYPQTILGKVFTIFYTVIGVPIMAVATSDLGLIMMYWTGKFWVKIRRYRRAFYRMFCTCCIKSNSNVAVIKADDSIYEKGKEETLPLTYAIGLLVLWLFLSSFYFYCTNPWNFFIAFYFFFISVSTIGLGDYTTNDIQTLTIIDYVFIIGGIALFSLCVRLFIDKLDRVDDKIAQSIINAYIQTLENNYAFESNDDAHMEESEIKQRVLIQKLIKKQGGFLRFFIGKRMEAKMLREYQKRAIMRLKSTQTTASTRNVAMTVMPMVCDVQTMAGESFIRKKKHFHHKKRHKKLHGKVQAKRGDTSISKDKKI